MATNKQVEGGVITFFILFDISPVQVSHLLLPTTKRLHYFYANQALINYMVLNSNIKN